MKKTIYILLLMLITPLVVTAYAQNRDGQLYIKGKEFTRNQQSVSVRLVIDARTISVESANALVLVPEIFDAMNNSVELPKIVLNGKKRQKIYNREKALGLRYDQPEDIFIVLQPQADPAIIDYAAEIPYQSWMETASFRIRQELCGCPGEYRLLTDNTLEKNIFGQPSASPVNEPVPAPAPVASEPLEDASLYLNFMEPSREEVKARSEYGEAYLNFVVNKWDILYDYKDNARKLDQVQSFFREAQNDRNIVVDGIQITGYASPEGTYEHNMMLSQNRASAFANWVQSRFRFPYNQYRVDWKGEDWDKLRTLVEEGYMPEKYQVLNIIDNTGIYQGRETRLMNLNGGRTYRYMLENLFPQLRRVYYRIDYTVRPFTVEESKEIIKTKPAQMSVFEMYSAANSYRRGSKEYNTAMNKAAELFPQDPAANNNAAAVALQEGRLQEAKGLLDKTPESPSKQNNLGVYYMLTGDLARAQTAFNRALQGGITDARHNLDIVSKQLKLNNQREREEQDRLRIERQRQEQQVRAQEAERRAREEALRKAQMEELNRQKAVPYRIK